MQTKKDCFAVMKILKFEQQRFMIQTFLYMQSVFTSYKNNINEHNKGLCNVETG